MIPRGYILGLAIFIVVGIGCLKLLTNEIQNIVDHRVAACRAAGGQAVKLEHYQVLCMTPGSVVTP